MATSHFHIPVGVGGSTSIFGHVNGQNGPPLPMAANAYGSYWHCSIWLFLQELCCDISTHQHPDPFGDVPDLLLCDGSVHCCVILLRSIAT